jgi:hypothetical protein
VTDNDIVSDDVAPSTDNTSENIVYNHSTEMSSFLPVSEQQQQEIEAVRNIFLKVNISRWKRWSYKSRTFERCLSSRANKASSKICRNH